MTAPAACLMTDPKKGTVFLSVVIPAWNEEPRIGRTLAEIGAFLAAKPYASEIILVDDGSTDGTAEAARAGFTAGVPLRTITLDRNHGKGYAVREGVLASTGEIALFCDADLSTPIEELDRALAALDAGADVVIGSRALPESRILVRQRRPREWMGKAFNLLVRLFVLEGFRDTQCGFKAFRAAAAKDIFSRLRTAGFGFDVEVLVLARAMGLRIAEIPVVWRDSRPSRVRIVRGSWGMLRDLRRIRRLPRP